MKSLGQRIRKVVASVNEEDASRLFELASRVDGHLSRTIFAGDPDHPAAKISAAVLSHFQERQTKQQSMVKTDLPTDVSDHFTDTQSDIGTSAPGRSKQSDEAKHDFGLSLTNVSNATKAEFNEVYKAFRDEVDDFCDKITPPRGRSLVRGRHPGQLPPEIDEKVRRIFDELERLHLQGVSLE